MSLLVQNAWSSIAWARGVGKRSLRIANIAVLSDIGVRARGEKKGGEKKLFPQVVYWQIQFPDQRWMASVVCASIESRFSSAMCIRYSFYDGYERRACLRDHFSMNFWSVPFSVNNLNPASKGTNQWERERGRERERADENRGKEEVELLF